MSLEDRLLRSYMALLKGLNTDLKLKLIAKLTESVRMDYNKQESSKSDSWKSLFGVWKDMDGDLAETIRANRTPSREVPSFD